jgi:hypothetical protein
MMVTQVTGSQLRAARVGAALTLMEVEGRSGVTRQSIASWEAAGDAVPPARVDNFAKVIAVLETAGVKFTSSGVTIHKLVPRTKPAIATGISA